MSINQAQWRLEQTIQDLPPGAEGETGKRLKGRTAIVTGAARGIGWAVAERLAREGALVALWDLDGEKAAEAAARLESAEGWGCDVSDRKAVQEGVEQVEARLGPVGLLVNNAGIWRHTPVLEVEEAEWDALFRVNVKGILFCAQAVASGMIQRRRGKIVNIASVAGFGGSGDWSAYCASKAAAISLTLSLSAALAEYDVQVHAVCPGATRTPMADQIRQAEPGTEFAWMHTPEEVAEEVIRLVVPFEQTETGRIVPMKPVDSALGIGRA